MSPRPSQASGTSVISASAGSKPRRTSSSRTLSRLAESDPSSETIGRSASGSSASRARIHARLPVTVLISPLWASMRNGWARLQSGSVFVE